MEHTSIHITNIANCWPYTGNMARVKVLVLTFLTFNSLFAQVQPCSPVCDNGGNCVNNVCVCTEYCYGTTCSTCIPGWSEDATTATCTTTVDNGWIVLMRRMDGSENFYRDWDDYKNGFGKITDEFWLGNECMHQLTNNGSNYKMRVDFITSAADGAEWMWAETDTVSIGSEADNYKISISGFTPKATGTPPNYLYDDYGVTTGINGVEFSTYDRDNDNAAYPCASVAYTGWWFNGCGSILLTGRYGPTVTQSLKWSINYRSHLLYADMKIKVVP